MPIGIVAEYNPFHNGHLRQVQWIKENYPNEKIYVVLSDKFTQRGELNVLSYKQRKKILKEYGVAKIFKLSFKHSVQAAHIFAKNAINKLYKVGITYLCFGSETNNSQNMINLAQIIKNNEQELFYKTKLIMKKDHYAYPKAYALAMQEITGQNFVLPNDILGFEYVKTIVNQNLPIKVLTIQRNVGFHSLETNANYASATLLRNKLDLNEDISKFTPIQIKHTIPKIENYYWLFQKIIKKTTPQKLAKIPVISEGMENLIIKNIDANTYNEFVEQCTSKRYTASRIKRIIAWTIYKKIKGNLWKSKKL